MGIYDLNLRVLVPYLPVLGWGAARTLEISALAIVLSFPLGLVSLPRAPLALQAS